VHDDAGGLSIADPAVEPRVTVSARTDVPDHGPVYGMELVATFACNRRGDPRDGTVRFDHQARHGADANAVGK
jgi:hypothetical protein